jgi:hypothetical protein
MRNSVAAAENDRCRTNAAKARNRASSFITRGYTNASIMYFFLDPTAAMLGRANGGDNACIHLLDLRHAKSAK